MQNKQSIDKYDKEFIVLMIEIDKRIQNYTKSQKLKIDSWIRTLCFPTNILSWKKNRNLYTILLLDNIINNKLESPFDKFCDESFELPTLNPTIIKSKISNKFLNEISLNISDDIIQNYIFINTENNEEGKNLNYTNNIVKSNQKNITNKTINNKSNRPKTPQQNRINSQNIMIRNKEIPKFNYTINQEQQMYINTKSKNLFPSSDNKRIENKSDILLKKKYFQFNEKLQNERGFYTKTKPKKDNIEHYKLNSMINHLNQSNKDKSKIIETQQKEINYLKQKLSILEKKAISLFKKK